MKKTIPSAVLHRLPEYYRVLTGLLDMDILRISSSELSNLTSYTASQIRQDLNHFGEFGQQGYGYKVSYLHKEIGDLLGVSSKNRCVILGNTISILFFLTSPILSSAGIIPICAFNSDDDEFPDVCEGTPIYPFDKLESYLSSNRIDILILACNEKSIDRLPKNLPIRGILNYTRKKMLPNDCIFIQNACLSDSAMYLNYALSQGKEESNES